MGFNRTRYSAVRLRGAIAPADVRAQNVHGEYVRKARKLDTDHAAGGAQGRFEARLAAYGQTTGLVLGAFGEASTSLHQILEKCSDGIAQAHWEEMGAVCCADAVASQKRRLCGEWGITSQREIARIKLEGLT